MNDQLLGTLAIAESWSVSYDGEVYLDAREVDGNWYYRADSSEGFQRFVLQKEVIPICKNLTRARIASPGES
jgi:hypothetical protein